MARFLALDWDAGHVYLLAASLGKGSVTLERALSRPEELPPGPGNAEAFGQRLRERLKEAGVSAAPLLIAVGRDRLILKEVRYPSVPAHEEPGVVRFQAVKELTDAAEDVVLDYQASEAPEPNGERKALAVAMRRDLVQAYQAVAKGAGVKLIAATPRSFGVIASARRHATPPPEAGTAFAVLTVGDRAGEFVVARGEILGFARALAGPALSSDAMLLGEIRRNLAVYAGQAAQNPVRALYVAEAEGLTLGVSDRIRDTLAVPVHRFDPLAGLDTPPNVSAGCYTGAAGLLALYARSRVLPVNFVKPREPKAPRDPNRRVYAMAGSLVVLVVLGLAALGYGKLAAKDKEIARLTAEKSDYEQQLTAQDPNRKRIEAVDNWLNSNVNLLDELYNLAVHFPLNQSNQIQLTKLETKPIAAAGKAAAKDGRPVTQIKLDGLQTATTRALDEFTASLRLDPHNKVETPFNKPGANNNSRQQTRLTSQWSLKYDVAKRQPTDYKVKLPDTIVTPERRNNRQNFGNPLDIFGIGGMLP